MALFDRFNFNMNSVEGYVASHLRLFLSMTAALLVFVGVVALTVFFIALRGEEQTMVPEVRNKELTEALLALQVKELYPRIQLRYSESAEERGLVLEQEPPAGTIVKAGRRVRLVVSQGVVINTVEDYRGRNIEDVRMDLRTLFASMSQPLLSLKEPFMYEYSEEAPGTILQQNPEPGAPVSGPMTLELVISRGPEHTFITVPDLRGLTVAEALEQIREGDLRFTFTLSPIRDNEKAGTVTAQSPAGNSTAASDRRIAFTVGVPAEPEGDLIFDLFRHELPENPYPLPVRLDALLPSGERELLADLNHPGGELTIPYQLPAGSILILSMLNREIYRETVRPPMESLSLDQLSLPYSLP
jgi:beta-lactam-binding protein with PASTA domain